MPPGPCPSPLPHQQQQPWASKQSTDGFSQRHTHSVAPHTAHGTVKCQQVPQTGYEYRQEGPYDTALSFNSVNIYIGILN